MFVKLFNQILDSSIADDRRLRHFFTDFLLCSDSKGIVMMTESAIARRIGASIEEVEWGIEQLSQPDPRSKSPDYEGRRIRKLEGSGYGWEILNFEAYRAMKSADDMREKTRLRVQRHREKKKDVKTCNADVTLGNGGNDKQKEKQREKQKQILPEDSNESSSSAPTEADRAKGYYCFDEFWETYPRKVGKETARKAFARAIRKTPIEMILQAIERQKQSSQWQKDNGEFIPHPTTWLNRAGWEDELDAVTATVEPQFTQF